MNVFELDTPVMIVDLDVLEGNIARLEASLAGLDVKGRPHIKTHKIPAFGRKQLEAGAIGICCQKVGEAEVFAQAGFEDILIAFNIVGRPKLERLARLQHSTRAMAAVDSQEVIAGIACAAREEGVRVPLVVEVDAGSHRAGVKAADDVVALAQEIAGRPELCFDGIMCYPTTDYVVPILQESRERLEGAGLAPRIVSGGGTGRHSLARQAGLTEHRSGTYAYNDMTCVRRGNATIEECAMQVLVTVVSTASAGWATVDGGSKTFTNDALQEDGHNGFVLEYPDVYLDRMNEEHGILRTDGSSAQPKVGEKLRIIPNHACGTTNLHDYVVAHRGGKVESILPIAARGAIR
ncbi:MAG: alanine racemase [Candidatus Dormibacteraceae bacterium]